MKNEIEIIATNRAWLTLEYPDGTQVKVCGKKNAQIIIDQFNSQQKEITENGDRKIHNETENTASDRRLQLHQDDLSEVSNQDESGDQTERPDQTLTDFMSRDPELEKQSSESRESSRETIESSRETIRNVINHLESEQETVKSTIECFESTIKCFESVRGILRDGIELADMVTAGESEQMALEQHTINVRATAIVDG